MKIFILRLVVMSCCSFLLTFATSNAAINTVCEQLESGIVINLNFADEADGTKSIRNINLSITNPLIRAEKFRAFKHYEQEELKFDHQGPKGKLITQDTAFVLYYDESAVPKKHDPSLGKAWMGTLTLELEDKEIYINTRNAPVVCNVEI